MSCRSEDDYGQKRLRYRARGENLGGKLIPFFDLFTTRRCYNILISQFNFPQVFFLCLLLKLRCGTAGDVVHMKHARSFNFIIQYIFCALRFARRWEPSLFLLFHRLWWRWFVSNTVFRFRLRNAVGHWCWRRCRARGCVSRWDSGVFPQVCECYDGATRLLKWLLFWPAHEVEWSNDPRSETIFCEFFVPVEKCDHHFNAVDGPRAVLPQCWRGPKIESMLNESWIVESC